MIRIITASILFAFAVTACGASDASVPDTNATDQKLQTKKDGSATGDGAWCSWAETTTYDTVVTSSGFPPSSPVPTYALGDEFKSIDGCNECACTSKGIMCTVRACSPSPPTDVPTRACTQDAKKCPDGSYVGRAGANCEFVACGGHACAALARICNDGSTAKSAPDSCDLICPEDGKGPIACDSSAKQCPDGSYVGRAGANCAYAPCPGTK